jgi:hypothetical protein
MNNIVQIKPENSTREGNYGVSDLKLQMAHNMALDSELNGNAHKVASLLLFALINRKTGFCFRRDQEMADCVGISIETLRRSVKKSPAFQRYFDIRSDGGPGKATEYRLRQAALEDAAKRRDEKFGILVRTDGSNAVGERPQSDEPMVAKIATNPLYGGKNCHQKEDNLPPDGGKSCSPNPVLPSSNPDCSAKGAPQTIELDSVFLDDFIGVYPKPGPLSAVKTALADALNDGADPKRVIEAARGYSNEQEGNEKRYVMLPQNWLKKKPWEWCAPKAANPDAALSVHKSWIDAFASGKGNLARHCPTSVVRKLLASNLITHDQCRSVEVTIDGL